MSFQEYTRKSAGTTQGDGGLLNRIELSTIGLLIIAIGVIMVFVQGGSITENSTAILLFGAGAGLFTFARAKDYGVSTKASMAGMVMSALFILAILWQQPTFSGFGGFWTPVIALLMVFGACFYAWQDAQ